MPASCLDRTLISKAVAGTGTNVTLLIHALTPLCPKQPPRVELIANHVATIVIGYICGFLPWGFITLFDFISAKWKTVRATRRLGYFHLVVSVVPMAFVIAYAVLQALSGDYKEMMTAVLAVLLTTYHIARTLWGLVQLREYMIWGKRTLQCIKATQPRHVWDMLYSDVRVNEEDDDESVDLDVSLMVNEEIVDNEFTGRDISVSYSWRSAGITVSNPELCTVRWAAAFLCSLHHEWKSYAYKSLPGILPAFLRSTLICIDGFHSDVPPVSIMQLVEEQMTEDRYIGCGAFGSHIQTFYELMSCSAFESFNFEFDSIVSSYPPCNETKEWIQSNRNDAKTELVELILSARIIDPEKLLAISSESSRRHALYASAAQFQSAFDLFQNQCSFDETSHYSEVHWFWRLMIVPCYTVQPNLFVLQGSVQFDNELITSFGYQIELYDKPTILKDMSEIFDSPSNLVSLNVRNSIFGSILGVSLDSVRALLAEWVLNRATSHNPTWWYSINQKEEICFVSSVTNLETCSSGHILSECQIAVLRHIHSENVLSEQELPRSSVMITLFLLSYPALCVAYISEEESIMDTARDTADWKIQPMIAPQSVSLILSANRTTKRASLSLVTEKDDMKFDWEKWINCAMALLKCHNESAEKNEEQMGNSKFRGPIDLIKKVDLSRPMITLNPIDEDAILSALPGQLYIWTAWRLFDVRFCQFELNQWMQAYASLPKDDEHDPEAEWERRKEAAMKTLAAIADGNRM